MTEVCRACFHPRLPPAFRDQPRRRKDQTGRGRNLERRRRGGKRMRGRGPSHHPTYLPGFGMERQLQPPQIVKSHDEESSPCDRQSARSFTPSCTSRVSRVFLCSLASDRCLLTQQQSAPRLSSSIVNSEVPDFLQLTLITTDGYKHATHEPLASNGPCHASSTSS